MIDRNLSNKMFSNEYTMWEAIKNEWKNISIEHCNKLTESKPKIIALLKKLYSESIPY